MPDIKRVVRGLNLSCCVLAVIGRLISGILSGNLGVLKSFLTEVTDDTNRGAGFSYLSLAWAIGTIIAPLAGGLLSNPTEKYPSTFSQHGLFHTYPYLLPCLLCVCWNTFSAFFAFMFMTETRKFSANGGNSSTSSSNSSSISSSSSSSSPSSAVEMTRLDQKNYSLKSKIPHSISKLTAKMAAKVGISSILNNMKSTRENGTRGDTGSGSAQPQYTSVAMDSTHGGVPLGGVGDEEDAFGDFRDVDGDRRRLNDLINSSAYNDPSSSGGGANSGAYDDDDDDLCFGSGMDHRDQDTLAALQEKMKRSLDSSSTVDRTWVASSPSSTATTASTSSMRATADGTSTAATAEGGGRGGGGSTTSGNILHDSNTNLNPNTGAGINNSDSDTTVDLVETQQAGRPPPSASASASYFSIEAEEHGDENGSEGRDIEYGGTGSNEIETDIELEDDFDEEEEEEEEMCCGSAPSRSLDMTNSNDDNSIHEAPLDTSVVLRQKVVVLVTGNYGLLAASAILLDETYPLFLKVDVHEGGLSFDSLQIGLLLASSGAFMLLFSLLFLPVISRSSKFRMFEIGALCVIPAALSMPFIGLLNQHVLSKIHSHATHMFWLWSLLISVTIAKNVCLAVAFTAVMIQVNHCVTEEYLGAANGLGQSLASLTRALGPAAGGFLWSLSTHHHFVFLNFIGASLLFMLCTFINRLLPRSLDFKKPPRKQKRKQMRNRVMRSKNRGEEESIRMKSKMEMERVSSD